MDKLKFIGAVMGLEILTYLILSITVPFVADIAATTALDPAVTPFPTAQAGLRWTPILLYFAPAAIGLVAIFLRLRHDDNE